MSWLKLVLVGFLAWSNIEFHKQIDTNPTCVRRRQSSLIVISSVCLYAKLSKCLLDVLSCVRDISVVSMFSSNSQQEFPKILFLSHD